jgi:hypothetical protein
MSILTEIKKINKTFAFISAVGGAIGVGVVHSFPNSELVSALLFVLFSTLIYKLITHDVKEV